LLLAQTRTLTGKITDDTDAPLSGANIVIKSGGKGGTQTAADGSFSITVPVAAKITLSISHTGYKTVTVSPGQGPLMLKMEKDASNLDDVVVIGYQAVRRRNLLASVSSVSAKDLKDIPVNSAAEMLNGRLAGVTATTAEGSPDATVTIRVRGGMSITGDNSPLYVVDGVVVENALSVVGPQDIQTIDVLKDAAAAAIYGARGANGVIVITTKAGRQGRLRVSYNGFIGVKVLARELPVMDPYDFVVYQSERSRGNSTDSTNFTKNYGTTWDTLNVYKNASPVDWQKEALGRTGITQTHNITASGGSKKITYNFSYTFNNDKAIVLNSNYRRHLLNLKADYNITDKLKVGVTGRLTHQDVYGAGVSSDQGSAYNRLRNAVKYRPFLLNGQTIDDPDVYSDPNAGNGLILVNPILLSNAEYRKKSTNDINGTGYVSYAITKNLSFRSTFGYARNHYVNLQYSDSLSPLSVIQGGAKPIAQLDTVTATTITNNNVLTYSLKKLGGSHDIDILAGEETFDLRTTTENNLFGKYPTFTSSGTAFKNTSLGTAFSGYPKLGKTRATLLSFFARVNYAFKDRYLLSFNVRADGSSKFMPGRQWGYFPAGSLAWRVKNEKFMENVSFISDLKLRAGIGQLGNNRISDYLFLTSFKNDGTYFYGINNNPVYAYYSASL
ncbi:MAG: SusC/RagA family TonB-linked outer membrane protein, partial [Bacteroidetes bacterium]|nr:SusC/RagA family TonB-linked outer membrane protein [Bacteroidota bacterium]